jgi:hypothetical protein
MIKQKEKTRELSKSWDEQVAVAKETNGLISFCQAQCDRDRTPKKATTVVALLNMRISKHIYKGADKSLARPGRKQAIATEDFYVHISYL